jgi:ABC-2 type transport system permease protein
MFNTIFTKTLYEKRWALLWWSIAMFAFTLLIVVSFPVFKDTFGQQFQDVPDSLKAVVGEASDYQRIEGYLEIQVFMQMVFLTFIFGIILFTGLIAGEESDGTLQTLLAQPVSRTRVYVEKLLAGAVLLGGVSVAMFLGVIIGNQLINESVNLGRLVQATFGQWLVAMVFGLFGYMAGAVTGRRGIAGALAGVFAFLAYLVTPLSEQVKLLKIPNYLSPFKYFNNSRILDQGLQFNNVAVLAGACVLFIVVGWFVFRKRDVFQR